MTKALFMRLNNDPEAWAVSVPDKILVHELDGEQNVVARFDSVQDASMFQAWLLRALRY